MRRPKFSLEKVLAIIGAALAISSVAGGAYFFEDRYSNRRATQDQIAQVDLQYQQMREDALERQIFELEREKARRKGLTDFEQRELDRLQRERARVRSNIDNLRKQRR